MKLIAAEQIFVAYNFHTETESGISAKIQVKSGKIELKKPHKTRVFDLKTA